VLDAHVPHGSVLLVSNTTVAPLYAGALKLALKDRHLVEAILPDGESYKTLATLAPNLGCRGREPTGARQYGGGLGGGVVGDMAGICRGLLPARHRFSCRCRPPCWRRWTPRSAARPASITPVARTSLAPSTSRGRDRRHGYAGEPAAARVTRRPCRDHQVRPDP